MKTIPVIVIIAFLGMPAVSGAATLYVPDDYSTIQQAIHKAGNYGLVIVRPGTYHENITFWGNAVAVKGEFGAEVTVIDGNQKGPVAAFRHDEGPDAVLDGFTLTNGSGFLAAGNTSGGGVYCSKASPVIRNNRIVGNHCTWRGGGIYCGIKSSPLILNNLVENNSVSHDTYQVDGGGIHCDLESEAVIEGNRISKNLALDGHGGGIHCTVMTTVTIRGNVISENRAAGRGGGISYRGNGVIDDNLVFQNEVLWTGGGGLYLNGSPPVRNNIFFSNKAKTYGGGVWFHSFCDTLFVNNTVWQNTAGKGGGVAAKTYSSLAFMENSILWNNTAAEGPEIWVGANAELTIRHSDVEGGQSSAHVEPGSQLFWGAGMIDADPIFVNTGESDFHIRYDSPCRDAGDHQASGLPENDFEGDPRWAYGDADMGADEFHPHFYYTGDPTPGGALTLKLVGPPGSTPFFLWVGTGVLDPPWNTPYGLWYLDPPILMDIDLGVLTSPQGTFVLPCTIPPDFPAPYDLPLQACVGWMLTNHLVLPIQ